MADKKTIEENERLKKEVAALKERDKKKREQLENTIQAANETLAKFQEKLQVQKEKTKTAQEQCSSNISERGQCILEHEKKTLALTNQLAEDNATLQERIKQLEDQLKQMKDMDNKTRGMIDDIGDLQKRTQDRAKELEDLQKLPETCKLNVDDAEAGGSRKSSLKGKGPEVPAKGSNEKDGEADQE